MLSNLRLAVRTLSKTPFVTAIAILSLALGIGANTAIFSLFDRMLLRPLPVPDPAPLVNLAAPGPKPGSNSCNQAGDCQSVFSYPMFRDLERVQTVVHRHRRARHHRREPGRARPDAQRRRHAGVGQLLPDARRAAGARPAAHARTTTGRPGRTRWSS